MTKIVVISRDLLATSQLAGAARAAGLDLETRAALPVDSTGLVADLVLLDLQSSDAPPDRLVARAREVTVTPSGEPRPRIVAYGPHVWKERLDAAVAAGADAAVSRGEILGGFPALVRRLTAEPAS